MRGDELVAVAALTLRFDSEKRLSVVVVISINFDLGSDVKTR